MTENHKQVWTKAYEGEKNPTWVQKHIAPFLHNMYERFRSSRVHTNPSEVNHVLSIGCGLGHYAERFVRHKDKNARITAIDISSSAIQRAKQRTKDLENRLKFIETDFFSFEPGITFDFVYDWTFFHHVPPERHEEYKKKLLELTKPGSQYLMACFAEDNPDFKGANERFGKTTGLTIQRKKTIDVIKLFSPECTLENFYKFIQYDSEQLLSGYLFRMVK